MLLDWEESTHRRQRPARLNISWRKPVSGTLKITLGEWIERLTQALLFSIISFYAIKGGEKMGIATAGPAGRYPFTDDCPLTWRLAAPLKKPGTVNDRPRLFFASQSPRYFFASIPSGTQGSGPFARFWACSAPLPARMTTPPGGASSMARRMASSRLGMMVQGLPYKFT